MARLLPSFLLALATVSSLNSAQDANFELVVADVPAFMGVAPKLPMGLAVKEPDLAGMLGDLLDADGPQALIAAGIDAYLPDVTIEELQRDARSIRAQGYASTQDRGWMVVHFVTASDEVAQTWASRLVATAPPRAEDAAAAPEGAAWLRPELWLARDGATLILGYGSAANGKLSFGDPLGKTLLAASEGAVPIVEVRGRAGLVLESLLASSSSPPALADWFAGLGDDDMHVRMEAFPASANGAGRILTRIRRDPASTTQSSSLESSLGVRPLDPSWFESLPKGSMFSSATSIDASQAMPAVLASTGAQGLDWSQLEAELGFPLKRLWARMGPELTLWADPIGGPSVPPTFVRIGLQEADAFRPDWDAMIDLVAAQLDDVEVKRRDYKVKDASTGKRVPVPITTIRASGLSVDVAGFDIRLNPAMCVLDDVLLIASSATQLKKQLKREYGGDTIATLDLSNRLDALGFEGVTTAWQFDYVALFDGLLGLANLAAGMGASDFLPIDLAKLPTTASLQKHVRPTFHAQGADAGGRWVVHEASFGPETWVSLLGAGELLSENMSRMLGESMGDPVVIEPTIKQAPGANSSPGETTRTTLGDLRVGIGVFELMSDAPPATLAELVVPTDAFPDGYLDTKTIPNDGWGRAFRYSAEATGGYRLWSVGADGVDQNGAGDDVVAGS